MKKFAWPPDFPLTKSSERREKNFLFILWKRTLCSKCSQSGMLKLSNQNSKLGQYELSGSAKETPIIVTSRYITRMKR